MSTTMSQNKRLPGATKDDATLRAQKEHAEFEAHQRAYDAFKRKRCTDWGFWELCAHKACHRHRACAGDAGRCFDRFRPLVRLDDHEPPVRRL